MELLVLGVVVLFIVIATVKFKMHPGFWLPEKYYLIIKTFNDGDVFSLCSFPPNQIFRKEQLEVISESR